MRHSDQCNTQLMHGDQRFACRLAPGLSWLTRTPSLAYWALTILYGPSFWGSLGCQDTPQQVRHIHINMLVPQVCSIHSWNSIVTFHCLCKIDGLMLQGSSFTKRYNQQTKILNVQTRPTDTKVLSVKITVPVIKRSGCQVKSQHSINGIVCI